MTEETATPEAVEASAREMGWLPQDEFKGPADKWVDATTYVDRGEHVLPIVNATNRRLRNELNQTSSEVSSLKQALQQSQETIKALEEYHQEDVKQKVAHARISLREQLITAKKEGNVEDEVRVTEEIAQLNTAAADSVTNARTQGNGASERPNQEVDHSKDPDFIAWKSDNPWFNDPSKAAIALYVTQKLRSEGEKSMGRVFLDKVADETHREITRLGGGTARAQPKVEGSRGGSGGGSNGGKGYSDLPADAKEACKGFESRLVGKGKRYSTAAEWHKSYAEQYFRDI